MAFNIKKWFTESDNVSDMDEDTFYNVTVEEAINEQASEGNKMILLEPRAFSETQQIADHLKNRNTVVVNLKRVTTDQAKRIIDFLSGTLYAIGGKIEKIGGGIFLCTPKNIKVQGNISEDDGKEKNHNNDEVNIEW